jgi:hypothetical protein
MRAAKPCCLLCPLVARQRRLPGADRCWLPEPNGQCDRGRALSLANSFARIEVGGQRQHACCLNMGRSCAKAILPDAASALFGLLAAREPLSPSCRSARSAGRAFGKCQMTSPEVRVVLLRPARHELQKHGPRPSRIGPRPPQPLPVHGEESHRAACRLGFIAKTNTATGWAVANDSRPAAHRNGAL